MMKGPVWFQKISIPPPWKIIGNSEGEEGGSKVVISEGWGGGGPWESIFQRVTDHVQNTERNVGSI